MKFASVLALGAATSVLATVPNHLQQAPLINKEKFLIELGPGETRWITEDEKWELKRVWPPFNVLLVLPQRYTNRCTTEWHQLHGHLRHPRLGHVNEIARYGQIPTFRRTQ